MAALKSEHKRFIVHHLAWGDSPTEVADAVKDAFGVTVTRQQVYAYSISKKWQPLIRREQRKARKAIDDIPTSHQAVRLRKLDRMAAKAETSRNYSLAGQLLEQIAKDTGGVFTNRQKLEHTGAGGKPLPPAVINVKLVRPQGGSHDASP